MTQKHRHRRRLERRVPPLALAGWAAVLAGGTVAAVAALTHPVDGYSPGFAEVRPPTASLSSSSAPVMPPPSPSATPSRLTASSQMAASSPASQRARSAPVRLRMPAIGVDSSLMQLGLQADGSLEVPPAGFPAGWFTGAPTPGQVGPAIIAGHVDWNGRPGVFYDLRDTRVGDEVDVTRHDGTIAAFRVTRVAQFSKDAFPTALVYGNVDHPVLRLITCGGRFDHSARSYTDNLVVFADLVTSRAT